MFIEYIVFLLSSVFSRVVVLAVSMYVNRWMSILVSDLLTETIDLL